LLNQTVYYTIR